MEAQKPKLDPYGRPYPPKRGEYYTPGLTTDAMVLRKRVDGLHDILMITRKNDPYKGFIAFPGGFIDYNEEPSIGCLRELEEETNLKGLSCELFTVKGEPDRDPRQHTVSIFYKVIVDDKAEPKAGDDAATARFYEM